MNLFNWRHCLLAIALGAGVITASAQTVIFPGETQPGIAAISESDGIYTLSNDLLSASFISDGTTLRFNGCEAMNLHPGTELFKIVLGNHTEILASDMTLESVATETLTANPASPKGSERFGGHAIVARFTGSGLDVEWRAILRDGSHYLRTELELTPTDGDVAMNSITPLNYIVDHVEGHTAAMVVGNTRGAMIASNNIFAGAETPMAFNQVTSSNTDLEAFDPYGWTPESFTEISSSEVPAEILAMKTLANNLPITADNVVAARGALTFRNAGEQIITFQYTSGSHRLDLIGVDFFDPQTGEVVASDYHTGFSGNANRNNVYNLNLTKPGSYIVRYFVETASETVTSNGTISYNNKVFIPTIIVGQDPNAKKIRRVLSATGSNTMNIDDSETDTWTGDSWTKTGAENLSQGILDLKVVNADVRHMERLIEFTDLGTLNVEFAYTSGNHRIDICAIELLDNDNNVVAADYHKGYSGNQHSLNLYTIDVPAAGNYKLRYYSHNADNAMITNGDINLTFKRRDFMDVDDTLVHKWTGTSWTKTGAENVEKRIEELGVKIGDVRHMDFKMSFADSGTLTAEFLYTSGNHRLDICAIELLDNADHTVASDYHVGYSGTNKSANVYTLEVPQAGVYKLRYYSHNADNALNTNGNINLTFTKEYVIYIPPTDSQEILGIWERKTTLAAGKTWKVGTVVGLVGADQQRRSVACYIDRERAVAWRPFPIYNSWFELNINRKDDPTYASHFTEAQCIDVIGQWKKNLYEAYNANIKAFVWDDGWDEWGTWTFNYNFPNGLTEIDKVATSMNAGQGIWLGPVGGYGTSGNGRRAYWNGKGGMQLSNPEYYKVFLDACTHFVTSYDHRYFKFDGISNLFAAYGPKPGNEEGAEGIIDIEQRVREIKPDIFLNTTVGTWASPFWYSVADATWRQEKDFGEMGNNPINRERWITYRDNLIHQNYVVGSPLCPINSVMSHGLILTTHDNGCKYSQDYNAVLREMRCAFVSGASMVELYCDYPLMNSIVGEGKQGKLWEDMAECIKWQEKNADVLADIHWVGGDPWTGSEEQVYGWASWNGTKSTLALRNGANSAKTYVATLREMLEIPDHITGTIRLKHSFAVQAPVEGIELDKPIDIDKPLTFKLPASSLFCYDGIEAETPWPVDPGQSEIQEIRILQQPMHDGIIYDLQGRRAAANPTPGLYIQNGHLIRL